ncbi:hypothetical protein [Roseomonas sp. HF4]|uniref:hypothetical protein n=1 Tax=Roseomonas sp. HF4 TaxID=2562313 RepID=UPI0010BF8236|nr:hypothetical protein [Roseomonas sp. HF4]
MDATSDPNTMVPHPDASDLVALRAEVADLRARLESYERILQLRDAALAPAAPSPPAAPEAPPLPDWFEIAADQLLPIQDGFYQLEWGPEGAFRWTGPGADVHFEAWLDRAAPLVATLRLFHFGVPRNARDLAIEVDGTAYPLTRLGEEKILRSDPIAPRAGDGPTRLTLRVAHVHSPAASGKADQRMLGVAFQRLRVDRA